MDYVARRPGAGLDAYAARLREVQEAVLSEERPNLLEAARLLAGSLDGNEPDRMIHVFGCGHSHLMAEEAFWRAGAGAPDPGRQPDAPGWVANLAAGTPGGRRPRQKDRRGPAPRRDNGRGLEVRDQRPPARGGPCREGGRPAVEGGPGHGTSMPTPPIRSHRKGGGRVRPLKAPPTFRRSGYR